MMEIQKEFDGIRLYRRNVGLFRTLDGKRTVRIEVSGLPDIYGYFRGKKGLYHVEIETKSTTGKLSASQLVFKKFYESWGGIYILAKGDLQKAIKELKFKLKDV